MSDKKLHTLEEQHTAMGTIAGFVYQFYYFLYKILTAEKGNTISFELYDDVATESQNGLTYCQLKHTVQQAASIEEKDVKLTDRASDLWKAISVWMKLIMGEEKDGTKRSDEEQSAYIAEREFHFVTNKSFAENKLATLCSRFENKEDVKDEDIDKVLDEISEERRKTAQPVTEEETKTTKKKRETVQDVIDRLKAYPSKNIFLSKIQFESLGIDDIEAKCHEYINDTIRIPEDKVEEVFKDFLVEAVVDFKDCAKIGEPITYTYEQQKKRFERVFSYHREAQFEFHVELQSYKDEFLDLICIKQLQKVKDIRPSDTNKIAKCASQFFSFKNQLEYLRDESKILEKEEQDFREDALAFWENEFNYQYDDTDSATEEELIEKAKVLLHNVRAYKVTLQKQLLLQISNGAFYYLSDECLIGWHKEWQKFFAKQK